MQNLVDFLLKHYATLSLICPTILGVIYFFRKWFTNGIKGIKLSNSFHEHFGDFPAKKIKELHNTISRSSNTLELRQSISEKYIGIGIYICEAESGRCLWTNELLNELFEMDSADMKGYGWASHICDGESANILDIWREAVKNNNPYYATYKIKGQISGQIKEVTTHAIAVLDENGQIMCYVGYIYELKKWGPAHE
jgi:hypothetical protein